MQTTLTQYVSFVLKDQIYAIPVKWVREIIRLPKMTKVPLVPDYIEGLSNLRGEVFPIINLKKRLGISGETLENSKVIVIEKNDQTFGIIVDRTSQVMDVEEDNIEIATASNDFVKNVIRMKDDIYMILKLDELIGSADLVNQTETAGGKRGTRVNTAQESESLQENYVQIVTFEMGKEFYGFSIDDVQEIIRYKVPNEVPNMPGYVKGIMDLRDSILPIIDLRIMLGVPATKPDEFTKVIVLKTENTKVGFIVDRIKGVLRVPESDIKEPPAIIKDRGRNEIKGIVKENDETIMILDASVLVPSEVVELSEDTKETGEKSNEVLLSEKQYVVFLVGEEHYGVCIESIREINRLTNVTKIPRAPEFVEGIMNLRGEIVPIIDLRKRFQMESFEVNDSTRIIVTDINSKRTGFIVDYVEGVEKIPDNFVTNLIASMDLGEANKFVKSVARLEDKLILILEIEKILSETEAKQLENIVSNANEGEEKKESKKSKVKKSPGKKKTSSKAKKLKRSR
ncbi:MAG: purine-binding chemotaxis protein CheW [Thermotogae bacterium]|nr:purine-binding chemotaxis protein CheW [Thermotogota bacterium]